MKTDIRAYHFAHFFLEGEMFHTKAVRTIKTRNLCSETFFRELTVYEIM
jgi:hypothetical protein